MWQWWLGGQTMANIFSIGDRLRLRFFLDMLVSGVSRLLYGMDDLRASEEVLLVIVIKKCVPVYTFANYRHLSGGMQYVSLGICFHSSISAVFSRSFW